MSFLICPVRNQFTKEHIYTFTHLQIYKQIFPQFAFRNYAGVLGNLYDK